MQVSAIFFKTIAIIINKMHVLHALQKYLYYQSEQFKESILLYVIYYLYLYVMSPHIYQHEKKVAKSSLKLLKLKGVALSSNFVISSIFTVFMQV